MIRTGGARDGWPASAPGWPPHKTPPLRHPPPWQGKHAALVQLVAAMAFLPGGLAALMAAYRDSRVAAPVAPLPAGAAPGAAPAGGCGAWWRASEAPVAAGEFVAAVRDVVRELPVWEGPAVEQVRSGARQRRQGARAGRFVR